MESLEPPEKPQRPHGPRARRRPRIHPRDGDLIVNTEQNVLSAEERSCKGHEQHRGNQLHLGDNEALVSVVGTMKLREQERYMQSGATQKDADAVLA